MDTGRRTILGQWELYHSDEQNNSSNTTLISELILTFA